jgi:predicted AAA+ superfamily ATPase
MYRNDINSLKQWYQKKNRKPLIIRGARQVGKSTLVRLFAKELNLELIEVNLEVIKLKSLQEIGKSTILEINQELESIKNIKITEKSLIFFDEIQQAPLLIPLLRYYFETMPHISVIAAGSLLDFVLEDHTFSMPVGRIEFLHLGPLKFLEFVASNDENNLLMEQIESSFPSLKSHHYQQLEKLFRIYLFVGGMPEAVRIYNETRSPKQVRDVHRSIIQTYKNDFAKYSNKNQLPRLEIIFDLLPQHFGRKIQYSQIAPEYDARKIKQVLNLLRLAKIIHFCYHTNASGIPLSSQKDPNTFKLYFLDIGLLHYIQGLQWSAIKEYSDRSIITKGLSAEQFAAQHLAYYKGEGEEPELFYWLRDKTTGKAELDFVITKDHLITPIEIKSGKSGTLKSLFQFVNEKNTSEAFRFDLKDRSQKLNIIEQKIERLQLHNWPLPLIEYLNRFWNQSAESDFN